MATADGENERVLEALARLQLSLKELPDKHNPPHLSHWRTLPPAISTAYDYITKGTELVKATSTKYTLVGKIDADEGSKLAKELLQGCEWIATGVLVICNDDTGCARACRHLLNQAARGVVQTTRDLIQVFAQHHEHSTQNIAAQKTGAVWSTCDALLQVPHGNRNSIRRELFTFIMECNETLQEFTTMMELGPKVAEVLNTIQENESRTNNTEEEDATWDDFMEGGDDQYSESELPVATASLALVKCSRGSLNVTLKACESVGDVIEKNSGEDGDEDASDEKNALLLDWIMKLTSLARAVGEGMTDLGACLYPPLSIATSCREEGDGSGHSDKDSLSNQAVKQKNACVALNDFVLDAPTDLPEEVTELASKLKAAANTTCDEACQAIAAAELAGMK